MTARFHNKWKILLLCGFILLGLAGCSNPRGTDGKTKADQIIASEKIEVPMDKVNISDITDEAVKKEYEKVKGDTVTIEPTSWGATWKQSWFDGLIVWPIAQLINVFAHYTDAGTGIFLATLLIQLLVFAFTYKSQLASLRMQEIQPELNRIQNKYQGKTDDRSRMLMAQETQKLYNKYDIHPLGTMLVTFIQLPIMMGMYYATMRASAVVYGSFLGMPMSETPMQAFQTIGSGDINWGPMIVYILMIVMQIVSLKLPKMMQKIDEKRGKVRKKNYGKDQKDTMSSTMNMTMYFTTAMIAFMYLTWPVAMSFYWLVSNVIRTLLQLVLHFYIADRIENKKNK